MHVIGLDPSLGSYGVALPGRMLTIRPLAKGVQRLVVIRREIVRAATSCGADLAVMEYGALHTFPLAFKALTEAAAVSELALYDVGVAVATINPQTLKMWATGNGRSDKPAMLAAARRGAGAVETFGSSDEVDAWHCRQVGLAIVGQLGRPMVAHERAALDRVEVPVPLRRRLAIGVRA